MFENFQPKIIKNLCEIVFIQRYILSWREKKKKKKKTPPQKKQKKKKKKKNLECASGSRLGKTQYSGNRNAIGFYNITLWEFLLNVRDLRDILTPYGIFFLSKRGIC